MEGVGERGGTGLELAAEVPLDGSPGLLEVGQGQEPFGVLRGPQRQVLRNEEAAVVRQSVLELRHPLVPPSDP